MPEKDSKYLDPKNDLTFRKIFGEHPHIMKSFLNSVMPFEEDRYIETLNYQDPALLPELPELKHSIVDVRCTDNSGRQFIVEMQMYWTSSFKSRMLFNAGKAYVKQLRKKRKYKVLCPVYGLSLVNENFLTKKKYKDEYYHHYKMVHTQYPDEQIKGIELIFIELQKFQAKTFTEKKLRNLWLRFLTEIDEQTKEAPAEMIEEEEIKAALECLQVSAFTKEELEYYDKYWDNIRVEQARIEDIKIKYEKLLKNNHKQLEEERRQKEEERRQKEAAKTRAEAAKARAEAERRRKEKAEQKLREIISNLYKTGMNIADIAEITGETPETIRKNLDNIKKP